MIFQGDMLSIFSAIECLFGSVLSFQSLGEEFFLFIKFIPEFIELPEFSCSFLIFFLFCNRHF